MLRVTSPAPAGRRLGPKIAANRATKRMPAETTTAGLRRSLTHGERGSVIQRDSVVEQSVKKVDHQVEQDQQRAVDNHHSCEQKPVSIQHGIHKKTTGSRD